MLLFAKLHAHLVILIIHIILFLYYVGFKMLILVLMKWYIPLLFRTNKAVVKYKVTFCNKLTIDVSVGRF